MNLGAQLYGFKEEELKMRPEKVFKAIADIGYQAVEMPFVLEASSLLNEYDLTCSALHIGSEGLLNYVELLDYLDRHDCANLCVSGPLGWHDRSLENFSATCSIINKAAEEFKVAGVKVHYHNHDFEFLKSTRNDITPFDILNKELDITNVGLCVDIGWLHLTGIDPVLFLKEHASRISYLHLRDFAQGRSVALGEGEVKLLQIMKTFDLLSDLQWLMVEFEPTDNAYQYFARSERFLRANHIC
ncbi:sugar phosphate isomerase/epimerase family protein [Psychromonas sp. MME1]|uniref:sugar phosphate isomerase/epimerase family protein n=1 Tax=Psychromonas sp. MME1 TaxID=3231032 RepID=UPI0034E1A3C1